MQEVGIFPVILSGTLLFFILSCVIVIIIFLHRRKIITKELSFQKLKTEQQKELLHSEINAREVERKRIAKDLHDEVGAMLSLVRLNISQISKCNNDSTKVLETSSSTNDLVEKTISVVRRISRDLMPATLEQFGYVNALKEFCGSIKSNEFQVSFNSNINNSIPENISLQLYRVSQELINNSIKHSKANKISVDIKKENDDLKVKISDNGIGFDYSSKYKNKSVGLKSIESRLELIKAKYEYQSNENSGTMVSIEVPLS